VFVILEVVFFPRFVRGVGVIARVEHVDYWDGEPRD
jgi:hypothetical protein